MESEIRAGLDRAVEATRTPPDTYSFRSALAIRDDQTPAPPEIWGGLCLANGQIMEIIGPSGLGKSRIVLNLAINQILGIPFATLPTYNKPLTWLFHGNENSMFRFRDDLRHMTKGMSPEQLKLLNEHLKLPSLEKPSDYDISLNNEANVEKLTETIVKAQADVVVIDPWGSFIMGDELSDGDVRETISTLLSILSDSTSRKPKDTAEKPRPTVAIIVNHSRMGRKELPNAVGQDACNYGKNSKALFTIVRSVWNLRPASFETHGKDVQLYNAKASDRQQYTQDRAVTMNQETHLYEPMKDFNGKVWQATVIKAARRMECSTSTEETKEDLGKHILEVVRQQDKPIGKEQFEKLFPDVAPMKLGEFRTKLCDSGDLVKITECKAGGKGLWGTKECVEAFMGANPGQYKIPGQQKSK